MRNRFHPDQTVYFRLNLFILSFHLFRNNVFDYLENLNEAQREAVIRTEGPSLIVAGAGSGKTRVLTYRIAHLVKQGVKPSTILALTFTNKAAGEMKERIGTIVGPLQARHLWMGTFHSIFARILRIEHEATGFPADFTIYDAADSKNAIRGLIKELGLDDKVYKPGMVANRISMAKNNLVTPAAYMESSVNLEYDRNIRMPRIGELYKEYMKRCRLSNAMDFDDLLMMTNLLFRNHPDVLRRYQERFDYVLVDEYQDTNFAQYMIINQLAALHRNVCVVGDDAQSIYSFRGARIENIFNFQRDYPGYRVFKLEQNYRSTQTIVNAANSVIARNKRQISKAVFSDLETGAPVKVIHALTDNEEGFMVAATIAESQLRDHYRFQDYAILYRTNAQSRIFEEALRKRNIPYKIYVVLSFYQRKEVKDLLAYFRMVINPDDNEALKRIINYPARGIGETTLSKMEKAAADRNTSVWHILNLLPGDNPAQLNKGTCTKLTGFLELILHFRELSNSLSGFELAKAVASETGLLKELYNDKSPEGISRVQNLEELLNAIQEFSINALEEGRPGKIGDYLQDVALLTDQDHEKEEDRNKVTLMTVHSAKGLEFMNVFIVGLEKNLLPTGQAGELITKEEYEEERRLFYVALTRAEKQVYLSWAGQRYRWCKLEFCQPSPFISEIYSEWLEMVGERNATPTRHTPVPTPRRQEYPPSGSPLREASVGLRMNFGRKISQITEENENAPSFEADDPASIVPGIMVEHQRFGRGKVLQVEGIPPDLKATVFFHNAGQKQLLLRFARLKIVR